MLTKLSLRKKIQLYACGIALLTILLVGGFLIAYDFHQYQNYFIEELNQKTELLKAHYAPLLRDPAQKMVVESNILIKSKPPIIGMWIYDKNDQLLVSYDPNHLQYQNLPRNFYRPGKYIEKSHVYIVQDIFQGNLFVGKILLIAQLHWLYHHTAYQAVMILFIMLLMVAIMLGFASLLYKSLTNHIDQFTNSIKKINQEQLYHINPPKRADESLQRLTDAFNALLQEINLQHKSLNKSKERLNLALWASDVVMFDWDIVNDHCEITKTYDQLLGYPFEEIPSTKEAYFALIHPNDRSQVEAKLTEHLLGRTGLFVAEYQLRYKTGEWRWVLVRGKVIERNQQGQAIRMVGTFTDISSDKQVKEKLRLFSKVVDTITEGVMIISPQLYIIEVNPAFCTITGLMHPEIVGQPLSTLHKNDHSLYERLQNSLKTEGHWQGELWEKRKNNEAYVQYLVIHSIHDEYHQLIYYVGVLADVTRFKQVEDRVHYLTQYDPLTSLPNRALFLSLLSAKSQKVQAEGEKLALILIGLDKFKIINDSYGYEVGDNLLQAVAKRLLVNAGEGGLVARLSSDEFALLKENISDRHEIVHFIKKTLAAFTAHFVINEQQILLGASIGVSFFPEDASNTRDLFLQADTALYHAKKVGGNTYKLYLPQMNQQMQERHRIEVSLRSALAAGEFSLLYQPKISTLNGRICGVETLLRWQNPVLGWVEPSSFIRIAEESGIIVPLGNWVLRAACEQTKKWHELGFTQLRTSVNLSAYQFRVSGLIESIAKIIEETELSPNALDLEITESVLMENAERCLLLLSVLKSMGITVSIDDFGTGYSCLSYLRRFPIDSLKIDRSFVSNVCANSEDANIVQTIIAMARGLKISTIAEGVETKEQVKFLIEHGVDELQGYYFDKPLTAIQLTERLKQNYTYHVEEYQTSFG